jgi:DNA-binding SARP family transcriptional activator
VVARLSFGVLGPLRIERDGAPIDAGGARFRSVVALLLLHEGQVVSPGSLMDAIWGDDPPPTVDTALRGHVSKLRKLIREDPTIRLDSDTAGYTLSLDPEQLDLRRFERLVEEGRAALGRGDHERAEVSLGAATDLWRGEPLVDLDLPYPPVAEVSDLRELRQAAFEGLIEAELAAGHHDDAIARLGEPLRDDPLNERLHGLAALAYYRAGRGGDALQLLERLRKQLSTELGMEPGPAVSQLEHRILQRDPSLELEGATEPEVREGRKSVAVVVARLGITSDAPIDPELESRAIARVVERARDVATATGGHVYEELGGRLVLVFGLPELHEDDAVRAIRTAHELRDASASWSDDLPSPATVDLRIGIAAGDVLVQRTDRDESLLSTEPLRIADELSSLARVGEILLTPEAMRLADGAAVTERAAPIVIDVGATPVSVFRLAAIGDPRQRQLDRPLVGRDEELGLLRQTLARVIGEQRVSMVTVIGAAGVGKSRLVAEFLHDARRDARVLEGRCLSYGREITYWPVVEMVHQLAGAGDDDRVAATAEAARLVGAEPDGAFIADQVAGILGQGPVSPDRDEVSWALRRFFEIAAQDRPLILVFDDLHWAETTLLDLVERMAATTTSVSVMLVCMTRPDLLEQRPAWGGGRIDAANVRIGPLSADQSKQLLANLLRGAALAHDVRTLLLEVAEGHPLFLEELLAMLVDEGMIAWSGDRWEAYTDLSQVPIPHTISALVGARLDRLGAAARSLADAAAVIGKEFDAEDLGAIMGGEVDRAGLRELEERDLIVREGAAPRGKPRYRFRHLLIRDAVYQAMPKDARARAHAAFGTRLEDKAGDRVGELEEIVGYHLEAAYRFHAELGEDDLALAARAASRLAAAGTRAFLRDEMRPAASLLERALSLCGPDDALAPEICLRLGVARFDTGDLDEAGALFERGLADATRMGQGALRWRLLLERTQLEYWTQPDARDSQEIEALTEEAVAALTELGDRVGVARAYRLRGDALSARGQLADALEAYERGRSLAREAGDLWEANRTTLGVVHGPLPVERCIEVSDELVQSSRRKNPEALASLGLALTMDGRTDEGLACLEEAVGRARDLGVGLKLASINMYYAVALLLIDRDGEAEELLRPTVESLQRMGEQGMMSTAVAMLGESLYRQGRGDEAMLAAVASEAATADDDLASQMMWRGVRAKVLAARGDLPQAETLAREAADLAGQTDLLAIAGDSHLNLALVLLAADRPQEAAEALEAGLELYRRKGSRVSVARAERLIGSLAPELIERAEP